MAGARSSASMRLLMIAAFLVAATATHAEVTFVAPQEGAQAIGPQVLEVATDASAIDRVEFLVDGVLIGVARTAPYRVSYDFGTDIASRTVTAKVLSDGYRTTETAHITTASLAGGESMNVDLVEVPLRARASRALQASDLRLRESNVDQTIREIAPVRGAAHFAFVVDRSLSMKDGRLDAAMDAIAAGGDLLRNGDTASLTFFNHHVSPPRPLTEMIAMDVVPSGGTSLRDAIASTLANDEKRTYVVVITDGGDRNSVLSGEEALRRISGTKAIVSAIVLGRPAAFLEQVTATTGGILLRASASNVVEQVERAIADINSRYTIIYQSSGNEPGWRTIEIEPRRSGISIISARKGYFAE